MLGASHTEAGAMRAWLKYLAWYAVQSSSPDTSIESWFEGQIVLTSWKAKDENPELIRFGILWPLFDLNMKYHKGEIKPPKALTSSLSLGGTWVSGGFTGQDFLVFARGLNQPRASGGTGRNPGHHSFQRHLSK